MQSFSLRACRVGDPNTTGCRRPSYESRRGTRAVVYLNLNIHCSSPSAGVQSESGDLESQGEDSSEQSGDAYYTELIANARSLHRREEACQRIGPGSGVLT